MFLIMLPPVMTVANPLVYFFFQMLYQANKKCLIDRQTTQL